MSKKILIFGTFDHFHPGHEFVLLEAEKRGDVFVVVARDRNVTRIKGITTDHTEDERVDSVRKAFPNVQVRLGDPEDFLQPVREIKPDLILLGYDQKLPPGVSEEDLPCPVERLSAHKPEEYKSSIVREIKNKK
jgi:FAD synthetase